MADEQDSCSRQASSLGCTVDQVLIKLTAWNSVSMVLPEYIPESYYVALAGLNSLFVYSGLDLLTVSASQMRGLEAYITMPCGITINTPLPQLPHTVPLTSVVLRMLWCQ